MVIAVRLLPALLLLLWAPSSDEAPSSLGTEAPSTGPAEGGGLVYPLYVYPSQATLAGIYTVSSPANRAADQSSGILDRQYRSDQSSERAVRWARRMSRARRRRRRRQSS